MAIQQASPITSVEVAPERFGLWGVSVKDYEIGGVQVDFETIVVSIATRRATTIEREVQPLTNQMTARNRKLKELGAALGDLTKLQVEFSAESAGSDISPSAASTTTIAVVNKIMDTQPFISTGDNKDHISKANLERVIQVVKSEVDKLNNEMQTDTTRLQSYVQKRDDSFNMASTMMSGVNETRKGAITAMGG